MQLLTTMLFILAVPLPWIAVLRKKYEEVLFVSLAAGTLLFYLGVFCCGVRISFLVLMILAAAGLVCFAAAAKKNPALLKKLLTPGLAAAVLLFLYLYFLTQNRNFGFWDDYSHWGVMVKELLRLDTFYSSSRSYLLVHKDYPPAVALFEVIFCKLSGGFSEHMCMTAVQFLADSCLLYGLSLIRTRNRLQKILLSAAALAGILLLPLALTCFSAYFYTSIYIDCLSGMLFALSLYYAACNPINTVNLMQLSVILAFMMLAKQIMIVFVLIDFVTVLIRFLVRRHQIKMTARKFWTVLLLSAAVILLFSLSWKEVSKNAGDGQFSSMHLSAANFKAFLSGQFSKDTQYQTVTAFQDAIKGTVFLQIGPIGLTLPAALAVISGLLFLMSLHPFRKKWFLPAAYLLGGLCYIIGHLWLYLFVFSAYEGTSAASFDRYMGIYLIAGMALLFYLSLSGSGAAGRTGWVRPVICSAAFLLLSFGQLEYLNPQFRPDAFGDSYVQAADQIRSATGGGDTLIISDGDNGTMGYVFHYYLLPSNSLAYTFDSNGWMFSIHPGADDFISQYLSKYQYLYLYYCSPDTYDQYLKAYISEADFSSYHTFRIDTTSAGVALTPVN